VQNEFNTRIRRRESGWTGQTGCPESMTKYRAAWWLPGPHLPTLWGKLARRRPSVPIVVESWNTPDDDCITIHRLASNASGPSTPRLLVLHGLEGSARSHYAVGMLAEARSRGWAADVMHFRTCDGELNRQPRLYHSGETTDLDFVVRRLGAEMPGAPLVIAGVSLGGNVLLKWLGEQGAGAPSQVRGAVAISVPYDLGRGARHIERGFSRMYQRHFVASLRRKARAKLAQHPGLFSEGELESARTLTQFDDAVTAPVHGFAGAADYYAKSSSVRFLNEIRTPTLLLSAADDPFLPRPVLEEVRAIAARNPCLTTEFHERGGHAGFVSGQVPWRARYYAEWRVLDFAESLVRRAEAGSGDG
jgi:predicted alpha/beta-fold hydrolase